MKRIGWLFCAAALFAANIGVAQEAPPSGAPTETAAPPIVRRSCGRTMWNPSFRPPPRAAGDRPSPSRGTPCRDPAGPGVPDRDVPPVAARPAASARTVVPRRRFRFRGAPLPRPGPRPRPRRPPRCPRSGGNPPPSSPSAASGAGPGFFVKFNNADIYEVIHTLGRTAGINYLIDPRVRGVVNVHTQGVVRKDGALELLFAILRVNGATAIKEGDTYHIVPMSEAKMEPLLPVLPGDNAAKAASNQVIMRAFPLQYIAVAEMAKVIKPFLSVGGEAVEVARANILLVIDTSANLEKTARLVELFDSEVFRAAGMKLFQLKYLDPEEMAKNLDNIFGALDFSVRGAKPAGINLVPIPRLNALLVVSASPKTMEDVEKWIAELDREGSGASRTIHRYRVRYGKVKDVAAVLEKLYPKRTASIGIDRPTEFKPAVAQSSGSSTSAAAPRPRAARRRHLPVRRPPPLRRGPRRRRTGRRAKGSTSSPTSRRTR